MDSINYDNKTMNYTQEQQPQGIIISVDYLNRHIWGSIHQFIKCYYEKRELKEYDLDVYWADTAKEDPKKENSKYIVQFNPKSKIDFKNTNFKLDSKTLFGILYNKSNGHDDFDHIASFFMLEKKYSDRIEFGINLNNIDYQVANDYKFRLAAFCCLANSKSIRILLKDSILNKETGEVSQIYEQKVPRTADAARTYFPLCKITKSTYDSLFVEPIKEVQKVIHENEEERKLILYIQESINKLEVDYNKYYLRAFNKRYSTLFEKWFILAFFHSIGIPYTDKRLKGDTTSKTKQNDDDLVSALKTYTNNIQELSQNIIYHTNGQEGYLYVAFIKKDDISKNTDDNNNVFVSIDTNVKRYVEFGVMDCATEGIVPTFLKRNDNREAVELINFFELKPTKTINLTSLDMRYAAHLGLKTFVSSIKGQHGYFYVESNSNDNKKSKIQLRDGNLIEIYAPDFVDGTRFHVIVPVTKIKGLIPAPISQSSAESFIQQFKNILEKGTKIKVSTTNLSSILRISNTTKIEDRNNEIEKLGDIIAQEKCSIDETKREIAIKIPNNDGSLHIVQNVYRLINYLQLSLNNNYYTTIVLTNLSDVFVDNFWKLFETHVLIPDLKPVWKNDCAIVLMSKNLNYRIISGEEKTDLYTLNNELKKHYCISTKTSSSGLTTLKNELKYFVRPYELLIDNNKFFYSYVDHLLRKCIEDNEQGYCVRHENTYIGSKMIIVNYYEAETLFQNSFFAERFAFLIAQKLKRNHIVVNEDWYIVGAGYHSDLTIRFLQSLLSEKPNTMLAIDGDEIDFQYSCQKPNNKSFFIIVTPIGSTLSYHDKIAAFLMRKFNINKASLVHHCIIIVGNKNNYLNNQDGIQVFSNCNEEQKPDIEFSFKWESIDFQNKQIILKYKNVGKVDYDILIGQKDEENNQDNWHHRIDKSITFPENYWNERYVNQTENQSINSQNLLGFPKLNSIYLDKEKHETELKRLKALVHFIYNGHIENHHTHYRYYIHSEGFVAKEKEKANSCLTQWMSSFKNEVISPDSDGNLNLIITPNAKIESEFVNYINQVVFGNNAHIINIDAHSWKNNMIHKYKYISDIVEDNPKVRFHYVDHALFTANTFLKTKGFLEEIISTNKEVTPPKELFTSIIVLINRVSPNVTDDIATKKGFHAFLNLYIPESTDNISDCLLCALEKFYERFHDKTISSDCNEIVVRNESKIKKTTFNEIKKNKEHIDDKKQLRLFFTHELFYRIAEINDSHDISPFEKYNQMIVKLDEFYSKDIYSFYERWIGKEFNQIDIKISFVKVISSPPLTRFIAIREYAHFKLVAILKDLLEKKSEVCGLDDLLLLKAVLKSLSFLNSTTLVRQDVILGSWRMYNNAITNEVNKIGLNQTIESFDEDLVKSIHKELDELIKTKQSNLFSQDEIIEAQKKKNRVNNLLMNYQTFPKELYFNIKNAILEDETKSMFLNELLRTGEECLSMDKLGRNVSEKEDSQVMINAGTSLCEDVKQQFQRFMEWLYYDTTTVLQKALANFKKETIKEDEIRKSFYIDYTNKNPDKWVLSDYQCAIKRDTIQYFKDKVVGNGNGVEYYYENLKLFISNDVGVDYIDKLVRVLYAKLKLERLVDSEADSSQAKIESDIKSVLTVLKDIMDSSSTFIIFKYDEHAYYEFAVGEYDLCGKVDKDNCMSFINDFAIVFPFEEAQKTIQIKGYKKVYKCKYTRIDDRSVLYFAYKDCSPEPRDEARKRLLQQLLLLLKNKLCEYFKFIRNKGLLDVWVEKQQIYEFFIGRNRKNTHNLYKNLNIVSGTFFDESSIDRIDKYHVNLYAILAELYVGKIHNSLLVGVKQKYTCRQQGYEKIHVYIEQFVKCARFYLIEKEILDEETINDRFIIGDFTGKTFYYNNDIHFLLFQFIQNITKYTLSGWQRDVVVSISVESDSLVIKNTYSRITENRIKELQNNLKKVFHDEALTNHISLYCINYYCKQITGGKELAVGIEGENTFVVKIPIVANN